VEPTIRHKLVDLGVEIPSREQQTPEAFAALQKPKSRSGGPSSRRGHHAGVIRKGLLRVKSDGTAPSRPLTAAPSTAEVAERPVDTEARPSTCLPSALLSTGNQADAGSSGILDGLQGGANRDVSRSRAEERRASTSREGCRRLPPSRSTDSRRHRQRGRCGGDSAGADCDVPLRVK